MNVMLVVVGLLALGFWWYLLGERDRCGDWILSYARKHHPRYHNLLLAQRASSIWVIPPNAVPLEEEMPHDTRLLSAARTWWLLQNAAILVRTIAVILVAVAVIL